MTRRRQYAQIKGATRRRTSACRHRAKMSYRQWAVENGMALGWRLGLRLLAIGIFGVLGARRATSWP